MDKRLLGIVLIGLLFAGFVPLAGWAEAPDETAGLKQEIEALKKGQQAIRKDLNELKGLIKALAGRTGNQPPPPFKPSDIRIDGSPRLGQADAPVTLVEFTDYQCPYCKKHALNTFPQIFNEYVKTGKLRYVLREFPLTNIHPNAMQGAQAALCAGDQGKYWEMHDRFFKEAGALAKERLQQLAGELGLNSAAFSQCLDSGKHAAKVQQDLKDGAALGIRGTPGFFLGVSDPANPDKFKAVEFVRGAYPFEKFKAIIDKLLKAS